MTMDQEFPKALPCHRLSYSMSASYRSTLETKREDKSFENRPSIIGDSVLAAPTQMTEYCPSRREYILQGPPHIYIFFYCSTQNAVDFIYIWLIPCLLRHLLTLKCPSSETAIRNSQLCYLYSSHFADQFSLRQLSFFMFGGQDGAYSTPFSWGEIRPLLR